MNYDKLLNNLKKFGKSERSSFSYWFNHWLAFNLVALKYHCWKFRFLFHDIEKPWMKLYLKDYKKVHECHRLHNKHHLEYMFRHIILDNKIKADWLAMVIDRECSRFTKIANPKTAREQLQADIEEINEKYPTIKFKGVYLADIVKENFTKIFEKIGL